MFGKNHRWLWLFVVLVITLVFPVVVHAQANMQALQDDMRWLRDNTEATLFFNVFGNNPQFRHHMLSKGQLQELCLYNCEGFGANFATHFQNGVDDDDPIADWETAEEVGMDWGLQIAQQANPSAVIYTINERSEAGFKVIVRFGTGAGGDGFTTPDTISSFLATIGNQVGGKVFYAIAGPNEPDLEPWAVDSLSGADCGTFPANASDQVKMDWYNCTAPQLAQYMKSICAAKASGQIPPNVLLLTPAFNATSESFVPLTERVKLNGGFVPGCFAGMAINLYPKGRSVQAYWDEYDINGVSGLPIFVTETGPIDRVLYDRSIEEDPDSPGFRQLPSAPGRTETDSYHYVSPILGLFPPARRNVDVIRDSLVNQGYEAYCATPTYTIEQKFGGDIEAFIDNVRAGLQAPRQVPVGSTEIIDYTNAKTPIFRATERKAYQKSDLEEFFGYRELDNDYYAETEINSAPINSLLSEHQKCMKTVDNLIAQKTMCDKLAITPHLNCALYYTEIPGTDYTPLTLYNEYDGFQGGKTEEEACHDIIALQDGATEKFRDGMVNASTHLEEAYRIAFLVGVVRQKPVNSNMLFNFFSRSSTVPPSDEVVVLAFKIPDIGTNKGSTWQSEPATNSVGETMYERVARTETGQKIEETESGHTFWDDAMNLTRNVLIPRRIAEKFDLDGSQERRDMRAAAMQATFQSPSSLIFCLMGAQAPYGTGSIACNDEAVKAVVDVINGTWIERKEQVSCDNLSFENVDTIGDPAFVGPSGLDNYKFQEQYGEYILSNIWRTNGTDQDFNTIFQVNSSNWPPQPCNVLGQGEGATGDCTTLNFYLVYPVGYDLETLELVLAKTFLTEDQYEEASQNPDIKERFPVFDDRTELDFNTNEEEFTDYLDCSIENGIYVCPEKEFTAGLASSQGPALFVGARLGHWIHEIQKSFNRLESLAHKYLRNCKNTEQFLLDQCGGVAADQKFNQKSYCIDDPSKNRIVRGITNANLERAQFERPLGIPPAANHIQPTEVLPDEGNPFFNEPGTPGCTLKMSVRAVDGPTLLVSGGKDIVPTNPGNILGCTGTFSAARKIKIRRLPPEFGAAQKATNPNWKPAPNDDAWEMADIMLTKGESAAELQYEWSFKPGYYRVQIDRKNLICEAEQTWVMQDGREIGEDYYVVDFTNTESCGVGACMDVNLQMAMEGGGPVFGIDDEGKEYIMCTIDNAKDYLDGDNACGLRHTGITCPLSDTTEYSIIQMNNSCGGGRNLSCDSGEFGNDCGFWPSLLSKMKSADPNSLYGRGLRFYRAIYGRTPSASGAHRCTHKDNAVFGNTIVVRDCENYSSSLDSLRVFEEIFSFKVKWHTPQDVTEKELVIPDTSLWAELQSAKARHGCDPWLVLGLASSEGEDESYWNDTIPDEELRLGMFQISKDTWDRWSQPNASNAPQCSWKQPASFDPSIVEGKTASDIKAQIDTACRIVLYSGMQKYPDDLDSFKKAFAGSTTENQNGEGWKPNPEQARYVWEFWQKGRAGQKVSAVAQPANWPPPLCGAGTVIPPVQNPPPASGNPESVSRQFVGAVPPVYPRDISRDDPDYQTKYNEAVANWVRYTNYYAPTILPATGRLNYQAYGMFNGTLANRYRWNEVSGNLLKSCELLRSNGTAQEVWDNKKALAAQNGSGGYVGCAAMLRLGDLGFRGENAEKDKVRTIWIQTPDGPFHEDPYGPVAVIDVAAEHDLGYIYKKDGGEFIGDLDYESFRLIFNHQTNWSRPQPVKFCDTREQCLP